MNWKVLVIYMIADVNLHIENSLTLLVLGGLDFFKVLTPYVKLLEMKICGYLLYWL